MWKVEYEILKVRTAVEKEIPCTKGVVMPEGVECDIVNSSLGTILVVFCDGNSFKKIYMEYKQTELCFTTRIINVLSDPGKVK